MKKILRAVSIITCICTLLCFVMFLNPGIVGFDDSIGFGIILCALIVSAVSMVAWPIYCFLRQKNIRIIAIISLVAEMLVLSGTFFDIIPFGDSALLANLIVPFVFNIFYLIYSK